MNNKIYKVNILERELAYYKKVYPGSSKIKILEEKLKQLKKSK